MKIEITMPHPRNPMAVAATARLRRAGSHQRSERTERQRATNALRRQLNEMKRIP